MIRILAPSPTYAGLAAGIQFAGGEAVVDETRHAAAVAWFRGHGYRIEPVASQATVASVVAMPAPEALEGAEDGGHGEPDGVPGKNAKKAEWLAYAEAHGISRAEAEDLTIAQLRERLGAQA